MKVVAIFCLLSLAFAEPPVGDGYASARSSYDHHDHHHDHGSSFQRSQSPGYLAARSSISQEYGAPNARSSLSTEYGAPNARSGLSTEYGAPNARSGLSTEYGAPGLRSIGQEYGAPDFRSSGQFSSYQAPSEEYGAPNARSLDQDLGISTFAAQDFTSRSSPSNAYLPASRSSLSATYGAPDFRSAPSSDYGVPSQRNLGQFSSKSPSQQYGAPAFRSGFGSQGYAASGRSGYPKSSAPASVVTRTFGSSRTLSKSYGAPESRSLSSQYGAPSIGAVDSYAQGFGANQRSLSDSYSAPNARALSQEYGAPSARSGDIKTGTHASSYAAARSSPSQKYGAPSGRMPSAAYGVPEQQNALSGQGYSYARNALDELINQEPASYDFGYKVNDFESGSDFGHKESRQENRAEGSYFVVLPDGTKQVVEYEADERGFKPRISVEPANTGRNGGYDDNAANIDNGGPY